MVHLRSELVAVRRALTETEEHLLSAKTDFPRNAHKVKDLAESARYTARLWEDFSKGRPQILKNDLNTMALYRKNYRSSQK